MQLRSLFPILVVLHLLSAFARADDDSTTDASPDPLTVAQQEFARAVEHLREQVLSEFAECTEAATKAGDVALVEMIATEKELFEKTGRIPHRVRPDRFDRKLKADRLRMGTAIQEAIARSIREGDLERARAVREELDQFKAAAGQPTTPLWRVEAAFGTITSAQFVRNSTPRSLDSHFVELAKLTDALPKVRVASRRYSIAKTKLVAAARRGRGELAEAALAAMIVELRYVHSVTRPKDLRLGLDNLLKELDAMR